ncbi:C40 family peptidase [Trujillonella endophytica]|uniref:Cell wall-associated hydrolase, NlpC family n=1 Tax=Trujillonella endophytica TaxID=673521 RepID=A0A1H8VWG2_9ACTN|nr:Cell wall-associated hydrolase, NlpC family [Trujillella endophytica]
MTTSRITLSRRTSRTARGAVIALVAGAGIALTPTTALAVPAAVPAAVPTAVPSSVLSVVAPTPAAQRAVATALAQVGKPYVWGGGGPNSFDCSGLTQFAYASAGISLPHSSRMQSRMGTPVGLWSLQPGDLLFYYSPVSHVAMYIGDGMMVHASTPGRPVSVVWAGSMPGFVGATRVA